MKEVCSSVEVARQARVSQATVSYIINGLAKERRISAATQDRVLRTIKRLNYRTNRVAHALRSGRTHSVALLVPDIVTSYYPQFAAGIEAEGKRRGYHMLISQAPDSEQEPAEIESLLDRRVDGLILAPRLFPANRENYRRLIGQGVPLVCIDAYCPDVPCPAVVAEDERGMRLVTEHLIGRGHRRIRFVSDFPADWDDCHIADRRRGYEATMEAHGLTPSSVYGSFSVPELSTVVPSNNPPTALACAHDYLALALVRAATGAGLRVPRDLAITGFSDCLPNPDWSRIPLTSVHVDVAQMGCLAMRRLLREMEKLSKRHEVQRVPATLVVRASSDSAAPGARRTHRVTQNRRN
ncbi:MAG: LacI family DNA-binding transcriptional regulator [Kiritimatiellae bacterium]|nr:LacI family DNA-binding transcriptional regulator [Kiritimatiellia bacterium]